MRKPPLGRAPVPSRQTQSPGVIENFLAGRLFTLSNVTFADGASVLYDAKHAYDSWRPMVRIPVSDTDKNPNRVPIPYWIPNGNIRADPPYPGAYAVIGPFHFRSGLTTLFRRIL